MFVDTGALRRLDAVWLRLPRGAAGDGTRLRPVADSTRGRVAVRAIGSAVGPSVRQISSSQNSDQSTFWDSLAVSFLVVTPALGRTLHTPVVTICTARYNIQQSYVLPTQCICVFCMVLRTNSHYFTSRVLYEFRVYVITCYFLSHSTMPALSIAETCSR